MSTSTSTARPTTPLDPNTTYCWWQDQGMPGYLGTSDGEGGPFTGTPAEALVILAEWAAEYLDEQAEANDSVDDGWEPGIGTDCLYPQDLLARHRGDVALVELIKGNGDGDPLYYLLRDHGYQILLNSGNHGHGWWMNVVVAEGWAVCPECDEAYDTSLKRCDCGAYFGPHFTNRLSHFGGEPICVCGDHYCETGQDCDSFDATDSVPAGGTCPRCASRVYPITPDSWVWCDGCGHEAASEDFVAAGGE